jgi:hypothetical protein
MELIVNFMPQTLCRGKYHRYPLNMWLGGSQSRSRHFGQETNLLPLQEIETWFRKRPARDLVAIDCDPCFRYWNRSWKIMLVCALDSTGSAKTVELSSVTFEPLKNFEFYVPLPSDSSLSIFWLRLCLACGGGGRGWGGVAITRYY